VKPPTRQAMIRKSLMDPLEDPFHQSVAELFWQIFRGWPVEWTTFPAGNYYLNPRAAGRLFRLGMKTGIPDLLVWHNSRTFGIELKRKNGRRSDLQVERHEALEAVGVPCAVCRSLQEVLTFLVEQRIPFTRITIEGVSYGDPKAESRGQAQLEESPPAA
jgi:hypothetical protein